MSLLVGESVKQDENGPATRYWRTTKRQIIVLGFLRYGQIQSWLFSVNSAPSQQNNSQCLSRSWYLLKRRMKLLAKEDDVLAPTFPPEGAVVPAGGIILERESLWPTLILPRMGKSACCFVYLIFGTDSSRCLLFLYLPLRGGGTGRSISSDSLRGRSTGRETRAPSSGEAKATRWIGSSQNSTFFPMGEQLSVCSDVPLLRMPLGTESWLTNDSVASEIDSLFPATCTSFKLCTISLSICSKYSLRSLCANANPGAAAKQEFFGVSSPSV